MAQRPIFQVTSPLGYRVSLTRDRWREIVRYKHPALAGHERELRSCVVAPEQENERFVVTAYFTRNIKKGSELWTS